MYGDVRTKNSGFSIVPMKMEWTRSVCFRPDQGAEDLRANQSLQEWVQLYRFPRMICVIKLKLDI